MSRSSRPLSAELAEAAEHFAHWRRTRPTSSAPTPQPLRERAVALLAGHRPSTVADALGINTVMLGRWSASPSPNEPRGTSSPFVALPEVAPEPSRGDPPEALGSIDDAPQLVVRWPAGGELVARGPIPPSTVRAILEALIAERAEPGAGASPR